MAWLKKSMGQPKKASQKPSESEFEPSDYSEVDENDTFESEFDERGVSKQFQQVKQEVQKPISEDEIVPFAIPQREGFIYKNSKKVVAESIPDILADMKNQLNRIERRLNE